MKKFAKILLPLALVVCCLFALTACKDERMLGTWRGEQGNAVITFEISEKGVGKFELEGDGEWFRYATGVKDRLLDITYVADGRKITFTLDGVSLSGSFDEGYTKFTLDLFGSDFEFINQAE